MIPKLRKKSIKKFEEIFKEQIKIHLSSDSNYNKENAVRLSLYYMEGYFKKDNSLISKVLQIINDNEII